MIAKRCAAAVMIMSVLLLSSCAKNPETDIIANKNEGKFEEELAAQNADEQNQDISEHYEETFEVEKDSLSVIVDADVKQIDGNIPVLKVTPHTFTAEDAKKYAEVLFGGNSSYDAKHVMTKSEIEERILELKSWIGDPEELLETYGTEGDVEKAIEQFENEIALWEKKYPNAPDVWDNPESDWEFHPLTYYYEASMDETDSDVQALNQTEQLKVMAFPGGEKAYLSVENRNESDYMMHSLSFYYQAENAMVKNSRQVEMSEKEAIELAQEWIDLLDDGKWALEKMQSDDLLEEGSDYTLYFAPVYENISSLLPDSEVDIHSEDMYSARLENTSLEIRICNGQLLNVYLTSPMDVVEIENSNINVLPFEEIYETFKSYSVSGLQAEIEKRNLEKGDSVTITRIEQKLFRVKVKGSDTEFRMIPVWVFYGTAETVSGYQIEETEWAVINAVDGSIVDLYLGY